MNRTTCILPARFARRLVAVAMTAVALGSCGGPAEESGAVESERLSATPSATVTQSPTGTPSDTPLQDPADADAEVSIEDEEVTPVAQSVEVGVGDTVTLAITADRAGELHVHASPEQYHDFARGRSVMEMTFDKPGAVDVEEHETGALLLRVLVR